MQSYFNTQKFTEIYRQCLPFTPTSDQQDAIGKLANFIGSPDEREIFVLRGYAGTGKTNLVSALSQVLPSFKWRSVLLAPTGRAAKVLSLYSKRPAQTIHKKIFKKAMNPEGGMYFSLGENLHKNTVFIVDEASMIGIDSSSPQNMMQESLLESLFEYVFSGDNCKLLLVGDTAQLPPVGSDESPALNINFLKASYHLNISWHELKQVARQGQESGILYNATYLRQLLSEEFAGELPKLFQYPDVIRVQSDELQDVLDSSYSKYGFEDVLIVTRSNKRANLFNQAVRSRVRYMEEDIAAGDYLMVVKNNYFWLEENSDAGFIANGDTMQIKKITGRNELYGFNFLNCVVGFLDYPQLADMEVKLIMESIYSDTSSLTNEQQRALFENVMEDTADEPIKGRRMAYLKQSEFYNALQSKFCYAVTCHKAQGGQWPVVFIDQGYVTKDQIDRNYLRWLYTTFTRATEKVYLINFSEEFFNKVTHEVLAF